MADDAGALLVRSGLVSSSALEEARAKVADLGGTLGEALVAAGVVDDDQLTNFYKQRLLVPQVNPNTLARLPAKVVAVIPSEMAIELRAIPVSLDNDNNLTVAMSDPSDRHAVDEIAFFTGSYVVRAVATQMQIAWCLAHYYGHVTALGERLLQDEPETKPRSRADSQPAPRPRTRGVTGEINASRHKGIVPGEAFVDAKLPRDPAPPPEDDDDDDPPIDPPAPEPAKPRSKTASGEIRVKRAPSIKPPLPEDDSGPVVTLDVDSGPVATVPETSGPVITIEADVGSEYEPVMSIEGDMSKPVPKRRRPAEPDPPELAARAGEVQLATGQPIKKIELHEPRIIIADELADEIAPRPKRPTSAPLEPAVEVSGEVRVREQPDRQVEDQLSSIFVELGDEDTAAVIHAPLPDEPSAPVLLERRRPSDPPTGQTAPAPDDHDENDDTDVVVLDARKASAARSARKHQKITQVGIGAISATTRAKLVDDGAVPSEIDDQPTDARRFDIDATRVDTQAAPPGDDDASDETLAAPPDPYIERDTSRYEAAPPAPSRDTPPPSGQVRLDRVKPAARRDDEDDDVPNKPTMVMTALELDEVIPGRKAEVVPAHLDRRRHAPTAEEEIDDGWGPPGTTIPPPLLGAIPGAITPASGIIPLPDMDSAPLIVAPPAPPERGVRGARPQTVTEAALSRALEEATARVLELIHTLDHTTDRDQIIAVMIAHLAETHQRAGFFAMRAGALSLFAITPRVPEMPSATLRLDRPSTLQDVVGTRLPYRGPMLDDTSRAFLSATLGACPPEILLVPIAVRERVVGVLFGDQRVRHTFDDQLALAARAAGMALERLLKTKRG